MLTPPGSVKLYPELNIATFQSTHERDKDLLALWCALRSLDPKGSGLLDLKTARDSLIATLSYSKSVVYQLLKQGNGYFWSLEEPFFANGKKAVKRGYFVDSRIRHYSLRQVCEYLGTYPRSNPIRVLAKKFNTLQKRRAALFDSIHKPQGVTSMPISRLTLTKITGVSRRQQQRYCKVADTQKQKNLVFWEDAQGNIVQLLTTVNGRLGPQRIPTQLGNTYHTKAQRHCRGMVVRVIKQLKSQFSMKGEAARSKERLYYLKKGKAVKAVARGLKIAKEVFYLLRQSYGNFNSGRNLWCILRSSA